MSGVGISFGVDRIYDVMTELDCFPHKVNRTLGTWVLFAHNSEMARKECLKLSYYLRSNSISCEVYPDLTKKMGKQYEYADKKRIPFVVGIGETELQSNKYKLKDMEFKLEESLSINEIKIKIQESQKRNIK